MLKELSDDEIEIVVNQWVNEDWATRYIRLNRGHWEDIAPIVARRAEAEIIRQMVKLVEGLIIGGRLGEPEQEGKDIYYLDAKGWQELKKEDRTDGKEFSSN